MYYNTTNTSTTIAVIFAICLISCLLWPPHTELGPSRSNSEIALWGLVEEPTVVGKRGRELTL